MPRENTGADYTEEAIRERIAGKQITTPKLRCAVPDTGPRKVSLLIDIQARIQEGKGAGYERWATVFNLKQAAQTLIYLQEHGLTEYDSLAKKIADATAQFNAVSDRMKVLEASLTANATLQKHIVQYSKTREVYVQYRKAGYSKVFKETNEANILLHQAAKKHFDSLGMKKIPTIASLRVEYAVQLEDKKKAYREFQQARTEMRELLMVKANTDRLLNIPDSPKERKRDVLNK